MTEQHRIKCENCDGRGRVDCTYCDGIGNILHEEYEPETGDVVVSEKCDYCDHGQIICEACNGYGSIRATKSPKVVK